jgi:hypothetical protein
MEVVEVASALHLEAAKLLLQRLQWRQLDAWYTATLLQEQKTPPTGRSTALYHAIASQSRC